MKQKEKFNEIDLKLSSINHNNKILEERIDGLINSVKKMQDKLGMKEPEILCCPFCGCSGMLFCKTINDMEVFYVECTNGHSLSNMSNTKEEAIKKWNERV